MFYVYQGKSYDEEKEGGCLWSPQLNKSKARNAGYTTMTQIHKI